MSFPSLRSFLVDTLRWDTGDVPAEIVDAIMPCIIRCLDRSSPSLEKFTLAVWELAPSILPSVFQLASFSLRVDLLSDLLFLTELLDVLAKNNDGTFAVLSHLEKLTIRLSADVSRRATTNANELRRLIESISWQ